MMWLMSSGMTKRLVFLRPVVIERRPNENAMRQANDIELDPFVPYTFDDAAAAFFMATYPRDVLNVTPSACAVAVREALSVWPLRRSLWERLLAHFKR